MSDSFLPASEVQSFWQIRGRRFCFIGDIALQRRASLGSPQTLPLFTSLAWGTITSLFGDRFLRKDERYEEVQPLL